MEIYTETIESYPNTFISYFNKAGQLQRTVDSSEAGATTVDYLYDASGKTVAVNSSKRFATDDAGLVTEKHIYNYNNAGILHQMLLIKNNRDTTAFVFEADVTGYVIIEKNNNTAEVFYYHYVEKNKLTDIVQKYNFQKQHQTHL